MNVKPNFKIDAIHNIYPNCEFTETPVGGETTAWDKNNIVIDLDTSKIEAEITRLDAEWTAKQ